MGVLTSSEKRKTNCKNFLTNRKRIADIINNF